MRVIAPVHIHRWAVGRPIAIAIPAQEVAVSIGQIFELMEMFKQGAMARVAPRIPSLDAWLPLYRNRLKVCRELIDIFWPQSDSVNPDAVAMFFMRAFLKETTDEERKRAAARLRAISPERKDAARAEIERALTYQYGKHLERLAQELAGVDLDDPAELDAAFSKPVPLFFLCVCVPMALEYGESPWELFDKAWSGDRQAIDKLLRIDKLVLGERQIHERAARLKLAGKGDEAQILADALVGMPKYRIDRSKMNVLAGALVAKIADQLGVRFSAEDWKDLLDAAAKDRTGDRNAIETALPDSPEARVQAMKRAKRFWKMIKKRDKNSDKTCPGEWGFMAVVSLANEPCAFPTWINAPARPAKPTEQAQSGLFGWFWRMFRP